MLSWLVDMPIVDGEPPDAWDQLLTDFHRIADQRGAEDPVVPQLREVIAVVEARQKSAHEDVAHTIAEIGRRIARAEGREI